MKSLLIKITSCNDPYIFFWYYRDRNGKLGTVQPGQLEYKFHNGTTTKDWRAIRFLVRINNWYKITETGFYLGAFNYQVPTYLIEEAKDPGSFDWKKLLFITR